MQTGTTVQIHVCQIGAVYSSTSPRSLSLESFLWGEESEFWLLLLLSPFAGKISQMGRKASRGRDQPRAKRLSWHLRPSNTYGFAQHWLRKCSTRLCSILSITAGKERIGSAGTRWTDVFRYLQHGISSEVFCKLLRCSLLVRRKPVAQAVRKKTYFHSESLTVFQTYEKC